MSGTERAGLDSVYSVLPAPEAEAASKDTLASFSRLSTDALPAAERTLWAEFDTRGLLQRGIALLEGSHAVPLDGSAPDALLSAMAALLQSGSAPGSAAAGPEFTHLLWLLPEPGAGGARRVMAIPERPFAAHAVRMNAGSGLTPAELRLFFQVAMGLGPREAATASGLSVETKRAQLKSLCAKLGCGGQTDVARLALGQLSALPLLELFDRVDSRLVERFAARHLAHHARLVLQRLPDGRLIRLFEAGPAAGRPVLLFHGMLLPLMLLRSSEWLARHGLRLLMPVRDGYLDGQPVSRLLQDNDMVERHLDDVAALLRLLGSGPLAVIGNSYGGVMAMSFALRHAALVERVVVVSLNAGALHVDTAGIAQRFYAGFRRLAHRPGIFRLIGWQFRKYYADWRNVGPILRRLFEPCESDLRALDGDRPETSCYPWFSDCYTISVAGIAEDFRYVLRDCAADLARMAVPVDFVHGRYDPLVAFDRVAHLAATRPGVALHALEAGHLAPLSHPEQVWPLLARLCAGPAASNPDG